MLLPPPPTPPLPPYQLMDFAIHRRASDANAKLAHAFFTHNSHSRCTIMAGVKKGDGLVLLRLRLQTFLVKKKK